MIVGHASMDAWGGLAYVIAGSYRNWVILSGRFNELVPLWECTLNPFVWMWSYSEPSQTFMLSIVSLDRLILLMFPLQYLSFGPNYGYFMIFLGYLYGLSGTAYFLIQSYLVHVSVNEPRVKKYCRSSDVQNVGGFYDYYNTMVPLMAALSIIIYIFVVILYRYRIKHSIKGGKADEKKLKAQRKLTISLGINSVLTFVLVVSGTIIAFLDRIMFHTTFDLSTYLWIMAQCNPMINFFVIFTRQREIRLGLIRLFKRMPPDTQMWKQTQISRVSDAPTKK